MALPFNELLNKKNYNQVTEFLEETYRLVLFADTKAKYLYYGPVNDKYLAPTDSVVLGFNYIEYYNNEEDYFEQIHFQKESEINDLLNRIQDEIGPKCGIKVAVIKYNEFSKSNNNQIK